MTVRRRILRMSGAFAVIMLFCWCTAAAQSKKELTAMLNEVGYGVPASPAFELLPDKPDEVAHLVTSKDFSTAASVLTGGGYLKNSVAFDFRPGAYVVGSLKEYQKNWWQQVAWRSTLSLGSTEANKERNDAFLAAGLRLSLIDHGDPRANKAYLEKLEQAYASSLEGGPPVFDITEEQLQERSAAASLKSEEVRDSLTKAVWNAFKLDLGLGGLVRVKSAAAKFDSLAGDRYGVWLAGAMPLGSDAQLNGVTKVAWALPDTMGGETHRWVVGLRARWFAFTWMTISAEAAWTWSIHHGANGFDDGWKHFALFVETNVPWAGGWVGVGYGGDSERKDGVNNGFQLRYSVFKDRILER